MRKRIEQSFTARRLMQVLVDAILIAFAWWLAFHLRFDSPIPRRYENMLWQSLGFVVAGKLLIFAANGLYSKLWRFVDQRDFEALVRATVLSSFALVIVYFLIPPSVMPHDPPRGVIALDFLITLALVVGARFLVRSIIDRRPLRTGIARRDSREVLIVGAGNGGQTVATEMQRNPELRQVPIGFVDDDP